MENKANARAGFTRIEIIIVVIISDLLAAMAIAAFRKDRVASQDKAVLNDAPEVGRRRPTLS